jgi:hypothetical protein
VAKAVLTSENRRGLRGKDMLPETYKIKKAIVIPLGISVFAIVGLILISVLFLPLQGERLVMPVLFVIGLYIFLESFSHQVILKAEGIVIKKFLRKKELAWDHITLVDSMIMGSKVYLLLTTKKGFHILSNNYERFSRLIGRFREYLGEERIDGRIIGFIEHPLINNKPVYSAWLMAIFMMAILVLRLYMIFFANGK